MRCQDIMKKPVISCMETETVQAAAVRMRESNVGFLPVCGAESRVVGILTDRDIVLRVCARGLDAARLPIGDVMTREIVACHPQDEVRFVEGLMARNHKSRILIVDQDGRPVGVVSLADIARHDKNFAADTLRLVAAREVRSV